MKLLQQLLVISLYLQPLPTKANVAMIMGAAVSLGGVVIAAAQHDKLVLLEQVQDGLKSVNNAFAAAEKTENRLVMQLLNIGLQTHQESVSKIADDVRNRRKRALALGIAGFGIFLAGARKVKFIKMNR